MTSVRFNPYSADFYENPYPIYTRLRTEDPVHWSFFDAWVITRYSDAAWILKDPRFRIDDFPTRLQEKKRFLKQGNFNALTRTVSKWLFFVEKPDHTRLRSLVSKTFLSGSIQAIRPTIQGFANDLIDRVSAQGQMDIVQDFSGLLPAMTMAHVLGVPEQDAHKLMRWATELFPVFEQPVPIEEYQRQNQSAIEVREYFYDWIKKHENQPREGLISQLISARDQGQKLSQDEIVGFCIMLLIVGQMAPRSSIGISILTLLRHPDKLRSAADNTDNIEGVVDELLRYDSPVQLVTRLASEEMVLGDKTIRAGDRVIVSLGSANRDPAQFPDPDQLNWNRRQTNFHFGGGMHYCLGALLSRIQGQVAIQTLLERLGNLELDTDSLQWSESVAIRSLKSLPVVFKEGS